jgi:TetR/AcrR family transcriptional repressor of nem operon
MNSNLNSREKILAAASGLAQAHGYEGLSFRELAETVGIKAASIYHHFPSKADLAAAVAKRYWEDSVIALDAIWTEGAGDPIKCLSQYPNTFRKSLENDNRLCLCSFMAAEYDDLPEEVKKEVQIFADVNIAWLAKVLSAGTLVKAKESNARAQAIFSAVAGAQLIARSRSDIALFDTIIGAYRTAGLF